MRKALAVILVAIGTMGPSILLAQTNVITIRADDELRTMLREVTADHWIKKDTLFATVLGGALAIAGGLIAVLLADKRMVSQKKREEIGFSTNTQRAIRRELEAITEVYDYGIGAQLKTTPEGMFFNFKLSLSQNWFTVYESNASQLGRMDSEISRRIVTAYLRLKQLIEEFRTNNEYLDQLGQTSIETNASGAPRSFVQFRMDMLIQQTARIRAIEKLFKRDTGDLFTLFDQRGIK